MGRIAGVAPTIAASYRYQAQYAYSHDVIQNDNVLRIAAREGGAQSDVSAAVSITPPDAFVEYKDRFGNMVRRSTVTETHREMSVESSGDLRILAQRPDAPDLPMSVYRERIESGGAYLAETPLIKPAALADYAESAAAGADSLLQTIDAVVEWLHARIVYQRGHTSVFTTADQAIALGYGVCQDFSHAALGILRCLGVPCRYVSGLLATQEGETHAWIECLHPDAGWLSADPTRKRARPEPAELLAFAVGRDYTDVPPVTGSFVSAGQGGLVSVHSSVKILDQA